MSDPTRRNVAVLAGCQALTFTANAMIAVIAALVGNMLLADAKYLATLPVFFQFAAAMTLTIPASFFMRRFGRRAGFSVGAVLGATGGAVAVLAIYVGSFTLLCAGHALLGSAMGFANYYRLAVADTASAAFRPRAISLVMGGGVVAAFAGPELAKLSKEWLAPFDFAGCYLVIACAWVLALILLQSVRIPRPAPELAGAGGRSLALIARQPTFVVAILSSAIGFGSMTLLMTSTPLAMLACGIGFVDTAFVIQWHVVGMFAPSFVTGNLIQRFGVLAVIVAGAILTLGAVGLGLAGQELATFWGGLFLLGIGWNFLYVGGTTLVTDTYLPAERAKTQAAFDFTVSTTATAAALGSGAAHATLGWIAVNLAVVPAILLVLAMTLRLARARARAAA